MPGLSVLGAPAQTCGDPDTAQLQPGEHVGAPRGQNGDGKATVAVQHGRMAAVPRQIAPRRHEVGDLGAVGRRGEAGGGDVRRDIKIDIRRLEGRAPASLQVMAVDRRGGQRRAEQVPQLGCIAAPIDGADRAGLGQRYGSERGAVELDQLESALRVDQILRHQFAPDQAHGFQRLPAFRNDRPQIFAAGGFACGIQRQRHDPAVGRSAIGAQIQRAADRPDGRVFGIVRLDQRPHRGRYARLQRVAEVGVVEPVPIAGTLRHHDQQIATVLGHRRPHHPARQVGARVDLDVLGLGRTNAVIPDSVMVQRGFQRFVRWWLRVAGIEKALAVAGPRDAREAHPGYAVLKVLPGREVAHPQRAPVGAAFGKTVGQVLAVWRWRPAGQRHGAVRGDRVRVQNQCRRPTRTAAPVDRCLALKPGILAVEQLPGFDLRQPGAREIPELRQPRVEMRLQGQAAQVLTRHPVLGFDPGADSGIVQGLKPLVGIGDRGAVIIEGHRDLFRLGVREHGRRQ